MLPTLLDVAIINGTDGARDIIEEAIFNRPELSGRYLSTSLPGVGYMETIAGRQYKTLTRTGLPTAGFRKANAGVASSKSTFEERLVETFILNPRWECDKAVAEAHERGASWYLAKEALAILQAAFIAAVKNFYYGRTSPGDSEGCPGLVNFVHSDRVVDATGSTADTGSSVWAIKWGPNDVGWVLGGDGSMEVGDVREESLLDPDDPTKRFTGYVQELLSWLGVQCNSIYSVGRICNLTAQNGKGLTDDLIYELLSTFPEGVVPDVLLCTNRSLEQLRKSRTATNATGAPAPTPTEVGGVPIIPTPGIVNTEAIVA